ncbi:hypothetical protein HPP92_001691 [Vanilla planifolia]|uniref:Uncharacterized protein n=1 Tax=Vanilla planifolia TaxID=51239 RepID=A0A835S087_VANPL|nr:hypothetical protein HPP92_001691 [Vanilla planifolia]
MEYIAKHGEGRWNSLARCAGLKRTGKSCRLRWLNYLRPDVRRGNITPEEQLLILELHSLGETGKCRSSVFNQHSPFSMVSLRMLIFYSYTDGRRLHNTRQEERITK